MDVIHAHRRRKMKRSRDRQNFKRKVADGEISPQHIAVQWRLSYPNGKISKNLEWRSDADLLILFDLVAKKPRLALTSSAGPFLVPPVENAQAKPLSIEELEPPRATPTLTNDALRLVFAQLSDWRDKIHCRLVCKRWERIITAERGVWKLGIQPSEKIWNSLLTFFATQIDSRRFAPTVDPGCKEFQKYKKILLLGISEERAFRLFNYECADLFVEICRYLSPKLTFPMWGQLALSVGAFTLTSNCLYLHKKPLRMKDFLESWRNKVLGL